MWFWKTQTNFFLLGECSTKLAMKRDRSNTNNQEAYILTGVPLFHDGAVVATGGEVRHYRTQTMAVLDREALLRDRPDLTVTTRPFQIGDTVPIGYVIGYLNMQPVTYLGVARPLNVVVHIFQWEGREYITISDAIRLLHTGGDGGTSIVRTTTAYTRQMLYKYAGSFCIHGTSTIDTLHLLRVVGAGTAKTARVKMVRTVDVSDFCGSSRGAGYTLGWDIQDGKMNDLAAPSSANA